ncbi:MAG: CapA family protein [Zhaonellaceae bacterium]|jgi:poly-gamma-glutamate capsule biosynthesis protein CapA/YwtB (metallophosphatase superfamily)|nr:CapA family protein [Clostridia bacterium]
MLRKLTIVLLLISVSLLIFSCGSADFVPEKTPQEPELDVNDLAKKVEPKEAFATLVAVGDIMVHDTQIAQAYDPITKTYNFDESLLEVADWLRNGDLTLGNLETTLAGEDLKYSSYPRFNTPESLAETLKKLGFDIIFTSNNHSFDRKEVGVIRTIENLKSFGLEHVGTRSSSEEKGYLVKDVNGIKMGFLAYTYGLNGFTLPQGKDYLVNLLVVDKILADVELIREQVDLVVCYLHFGQEYKSEPTNEQKDIVEVLWDAGVDIVLGSHPHVLQEICLSKDRNKLVIYSMGNFVSSQKGLERQTSAIFRINIKKDLTENKVIIEEVEYIPIYTYRYIEDNRLKFKVLPLGYTLQSKPYDFVKEDDYLNLEKALRHAEHIMSLNSAGVIIRQ